MKDYCSIHQLGFLLDYGRLLFKAGFRVGGLVGVRVGFRVGDLVGVRVGFRVGDLVGVRVGF